MKLDLAIIELQRSRDQHSNNASLHAQAGDKAQAQLCRKVAKQCKEAQHVLETYIAYGKAFENLVSHTTHDYLRGES